jgi:signal transduction histidine kinase
MVRVNGDSDMVRFEVEDDGLGMDQETQEKAFSLFFSTKGTGTGLGLFISDKIAHAHGGDIDLYSKLGEGTKFVVTLPRVRVNESGDPESPMTKGITIDA